ncbi:hypothetical protein EIN_170640 [Entamoeba invadens IP1]|uniref:Nucleosome assembly protein n=1 Tax=Entamoeba invadens IP1 TaxID=370355 RepID=A0A0A1TVN2_ENTIV|nr:hypothetical protein EIN_170640 [Entamoeba invadens IP1]ELP84539.1 hypothetical protein EIN_170640 [Entamoeba invadens IP1]|eukprot:XP_004183885.1 hypothetical protein EIN_170640 [Entamoeba invadens IP1]
MSNFNTFRDTMARLNELKEVQNEQIKKLPYFWYYVVVNSSWAERLLSNNTDREVLQYLRDITITHVKSEKVKHTILEHEDTLLVGFVVTFQFNPNPYMNKTTLTKEVKYNLNPTNNPITCVANSGIEMTDLYYERLGKNDSFFDFFDIFDDEAMEEIEKIDIDICKKIAKESLPFALEYFLAIESSQYEKEEEEQYDDYEEYYD